jgi:hypothetical protein
MLSVLDSKLCNNKKIERSETLTLGFLITLGIGNIIIYLVNF